MVQIKEKVKQTHKEYQDALKVKEPRYLYSISGFESLIDYFVLEECM